jgi:hypothetical protein
MVVMEGSMTNQAQSYLSARPSTHNSPHVFRRSNSTTHAIVPLPSENRNVKYAPNDMVCSHISYLVTHKTRQHQGARAELAINALNQVISISLIVHAIQNCRVE